MDKQEKFRVVSSAIKEERRRRRIQEEILGTQALPEGSCEFLGEGFNLVERQLMYIREGCGYWRDLHGELLDIALDYVTKKFARS